MQKQVSKAHNYIPQILWYVITWSCPWYLLPAQHSSFISPAKNISLRGIVFFSYHSVGFIIPTSAACEVSGIKTENTLIVVPFVTAETDDLIPGWWQWWSWGVWKQSETRACVNHDFIRDPVNCYSLFKELSVTYGNSSGVWGLHHLLMKMILYGMVYVEKLFKAIVMKAYCTENIWV